MHLIMFNLDLETVNLSKADFMNVLLRNNIFSILYSIIIEEKTEDQEFIVCS